MSWIILSFGIGFFVGAAWYCKEIKTDLAKGQVFYVGDTAYRAHEIKEPK